MKKLTKIIGTLVIVGLLVANVGGADGIALSIPVAFAQTGGASGSGQEILCRSGTRDWASFLSSLIGYDDFVEYWKDILVRYNGNICLYNDIDSLLLKVNKAREQIRKAFYVCDVNASKMKENYYKLEAELFFLRKYMTVDKNQILFEPDAKVKNEMKDYFVFNKGFYTPEKVLQLYQEFKDKYKAKEDTYTHCKDPTWTNIIAKWNDIKETVTGTAANFTESIKKSYDRMANTPWLDVGHLLGGFLDLRINGLDPRTAFSELAAELTKDLPSGYTYAQFDAANTAEGVRYQDNLNRTQYLTQYEFLYKQGSDDILTSILDKLDHLDKTIVDTYPYINQTYKCTAGIINKSCGGVSF